MTANRSLGSPRFARLTPAQCEQIHQASLSILARTGVRMLEPAAIELMRRAGASIDGDRVRVPARLVDQALKTVPRSITLYDRRGQPAIELDDYRVYFGPGSDVLNIVDHRTGERRQPRLQDVRDGVTVCDALSNIHFVMSMFLPGDVDNRISDRYQMEVMLTHTTKPIVIVTYETAGLIDTIEMAEAAAGGAAALREKPFVACYINVTTGLLHNQDALQKLLYLAAKNLPALWIPVTSGGTTGPVTMAGNLAMNNAGVLVGLVLSQLQREGAPVIIPGFAGDALDLKTMVDPYAEPDHRGIATAMAHYYGLPMFSLAGGSDTKVVDQQAAIDASLTILMEALSGGQLIHDLGYLESGLSGSLAQLAICDEIVSFIKPFLQPVEINDETLALDLIDQIGPDGSFLNTPHTRRHYKERWYPNLIERFNYGQWQARGGKTLAERAADKVEKILATHQPPLLSEDAARAVHTIVERAARSLTH
ncbi:MAG: trimethylamine methyltransferase family protein [Chloroflexi bacterium]|nr:trimethylamine methyltransferase family protein [Chloroflexota bacterium]